MKFETFAPLGLHRNLNGILSMQTFHSPPLFFVFAYDLIQLTALVKHKFNMSLKNGHGIRPSDQTKFILSFDEKTISNLFYYLVCLNHRSTKTKFQIIAITFKITMI